MSNTWGISGPAFLGVYFLLVLVGGVLVAYPVRAQLAAAGVRRPWGRRSEVPVPVSLQPYELAYLSGRTGRVATVAVTELVAAGHLRVDSGGRLSATEPGPGASDEVSETALSVVRSHSGARLPDVEKALRNSPPLEAAQERLIGFGYAAKVDLRPWRRRLVVVFALLLALGVVRAAAGAARHHPIAFLVFVMILLGSGTVLAFNALGEKVVNTGYGSAVAGEYATTLRPELASALAVAALGLAAVDDRDVAKWLAKGAGGAGGSAGAGGCGGGGCGGGGCGG